MGEHGVKILLPWPPRELWPNSRVHWRRKAEAVKMYRNLAHWSAVALSGAGPTPPANAVTLTFNPPDRIKRDMDNMLAAMKAGLDGIAGALGVDDSKWSIIIRKGDVVKGGQVVVEVTA